MAFHGAHCFPTRLPRCVWSASTPPFVTIIFIPACFIVIPFAYFEAFYKFAERALPSTSAFLICWQGRRLESIWAFHVGGRCTFTRTINMASQGLHWRKIEPAARVKVSTKAPRGDNYLNLSAKRGPPVTIPIYVESSVPCSLAFWLRSSKCHHYYFLATCYKYHCKHGQATKVSRQMRSRNTLRLSCDWLVLMMTQATRSFYFAWRMLLLNRNWTFLGISFSTNPSPWSLPSASCSAKPISSHSMPPSCPLALDWTPVHFQAWLAISPALYP